VILIRRREVRPFTDKQIALLQTFADQAVIAIENVRLFKELQDRTAELTRSVEELRALGEVSQAVSSTLDLETVLATIVSRAVQLSGSYSGIVYEFEEATQTFHARATHQVTPEHLETLRESPIRLGAGAGGPESSGSPSRSLTSSTSSCRPGRERFSSGKVWDRWSPFR
jgi:GAF domain-containing protein